MVTFYIQITRIKEHSIQTRAVISIFLVLFTEIEMQFCAPSTHKHCAIEMHLIWNVQRSMQIKQKPKADTSFAEHEKLTNNLSTAVILSRTLFVIEIAL